jgi:hypothetical protein
VIEAELCIVLETTSEFFHCYLGDQIGVLHSPKNDFEDFFHRYLGDQIGALHSLMNEFGTFCTTT